MSENMRHVRAVDQDTKAGTHSSRVQTSAQHYAMDLSILLNSIGFPLDLVPQGINSSEQDFQDECFVQSSEVYATSLNQSQWSTTSTPVFPDFISDHGTAEYTGSTPVTPIQPLSGSFVFPPPHTYQNPGPCPFPAEDWLPSPHFSYPNPSCPIPNNYANHASELPPNTPHYGRYDVPVPTLSRPLHPCDGEMYHPLLYGLGDPPRPDSLIASGNGNVTMNEGRGGCSPGPTPKGKAKG